MFAPHTTCGQVAQFHSELKHPEPEHRDVKTQVETGSKLTPAWPNCLGWDHLALTGPKMQKRLLVLALLRARKSHRCPLPDTLKEHFPPDLEPMEVSGVNNFVQTGCVCCCGQEHLPLCPSRVQEQPFPAPAPSLGLSPSWLSSPLPPGHRGLPQDPGAWQPPTSSIPQHLLGFSNMALGPPGK